MLTCSGSNHICGLDPGFLFSEQESFHLKEGLEITSYVPTLLALKFTYLAFHEKRYILDIKNRKEKDFKDTKYKEK